MSGLGQTPYRKGRKEERKGRKGKSFKSLVMDQLTHTSLLGLQLPELAALVEEFGQPRLPRAPVV